MDAQPQPSDAQTWQWVSIRPRIHTVMSWRTSRRPRLHRLWAVRRSPALGRDRSNVAVAFSERDIIAVAVQKGERCRRRARSSTAIPWLIDGALSCHTPARSRWQAWPWPKRKTPRVHRLAALAAGYEIRIVSASRGHPSLAAIT
jgi:hypothetical protein